MNSISQPNIDTFDFDGFDFEFSDFESCDDQESSFVDTSESFSNPSNNSDQSTSFSSENYTTHSATTQSVITNSNYTLSTADRDTISQNNQEYVHTLLHYPTLSPAQLAVILNYQHSHNQQILPTNYHKYPKKRRRKPYTLEQREKSNERRRYLYNQRNITREFHETFMNMVCNVNNMGDLSLFKSFVDRFYHPNFVFYKAIKDKHNANICHYYGSIGRNHYYDILSLISQSSPDLIYVLRGQQIKYDPITKQTMIIAKMRQHSTRTKVLSSIFSQIMSRLQELTSSLLPFSKKKQKQKNLSTIKVQTPDQNSNKISSFQENNLENNIVEDKLDEYDHMIHQLQTNASAQHIEIFDSHHLTSMINPFIHHLTSSNTFISISFSKLLANFNFTTICQKFLSNSTYHHNSNENNLFVSLLSWFPFGIKVESDYSVYYTVNEHQQMMQVVVYFEQIKLEVSSSDRTNRTINYFSEMKL